MHWKIKAAVQNTVALLPQDLSYTSYLTLQRAFGRLRHLNPKRNLGTAVGLLNLIEHVGHSAYNKTFFEIGTGRQVAMPLGLWLCGAKQVITVDPNPYLREDFVLADIAYIAQHTAEINKLFGAYATRSIFQERLQQLCEMHPQSIQDVLRATNIHYLSPADARHTALRAGSIDYHVSVTVLEHIPPDALVEVFREAHRILSPNGLFVHWFGPKDHFATSDPSITTINFLQYDDKTWDRYAGNRYMYHNRLRIDDYIHLIEQENFRILHEERVIDERAMQQLRDGFHVDARFAGKSFEDLATASSKMVACPLPC